MAKVAIVTGSNKGIGFETVKGLCKAFKGTVYLTARNESLGQEAVASLKKEGLNPAFHQLDIDNEKSIADFKRYIETKYGGIDVLVNNAGFAYSGADKTPVAVQAENTMKINFFATLNFCNAMFPLLRPHARVVNVSSILGLPFLIPSQELREKLKSDDLTVEQLKQMATQFVADAKAGKLGEWGNSTYVVSKVCVSALTRIQHRQFLKDPRPDIVINHVHPGYVATDMSGHKGNLKPEEGAAASIYLALLPENATSPKGDFVWYDKTIYDWKTHTFSGL